MPLLFGSYRRWVIMVLCCIENLFLGGIFLGWNGLVPVWTEIGIFGCHNDSGVSNKSGSPVQPNQSCNQDYMLSAAYIVASTLYLVFNLPTGIIFDRVPLRVSKMIYAVIFVAGCILMSFVTPAASALIFPAGIFYSASSTFFLISNNRVSDFFPESKNLVIAIINGAFDSSSVVFQLIAFGYRAGISLQISFIVLGASGFLLMTFIAFFLFPWRYMTDKYVPRIKNSGQEEKYRAEMDEKTGAVADETTRDRPEMAFENDANFEQRAERGHAQKQEPEVKESEDKNQKNSSNEVSRIISVIFSRHYLLQLVWLSCQFLRFQYMISAMNQVVEHRFPDRGAVFNRIFVAFSFFLFSGIGIAIVVGFFMNALMRWIAPTEKFTQEKSLRVIGIGEAICSLLSLVFTGLVFIEGEMVFYFIFALFAIYRSFLFTLLASFAVYYFPKIHYGKLLGLQSVICGSFSALQFALLKLNFFQGNLILIVGILISFAQPINLIIGGRKCCKSEGKATIS